MLFMVIERFRDHNARAVYIRLAQRGRMMPEGMRVLSAHVAADLSRCWQLMECEDLTLMQRWMSEWSDLIDCEIVPVSDGEETQAALTPK
jgi:hypothetical protein